ncbi:hypothetical protein HJB56_28820 [Rhizobium lentis]|uniref:hypothetical protein n=1 Tax=Rhizobium lentis TaxID=1138194 RepID=UPI001C833A28|nr:hypothetical protein [Rhizobium lentis]MBX5086731.1 hypothetical protein [Rhizobium lentis]MBX5099376.1 hypothetical protein [Rhizobium lentis]MBX5124293.1 hypothetical protein [Rhizobium lentis]
MAKTEDEAHRTTSKKPYNERSDLEKLRSQWNKLSGLHLRDEPSAAIVRCATAAEIAANYAIRTEWARQTQFDAAIVDQFLRWANGLHGKVTRLFVPIYFAHPAKSKVGKDLVKSAEKINAVRNAVVHQGEFSNAKEAEAAIVEAKTFINLIVGLSNPGFDIADKATSK